MDSVIYLLIDGVMEENENVPMGITVELGPIQEEERLAYEELVTNEDIAELLKILRLDHIWTPDKVKVVTKEEYLRHFPDGAGDAADNDEEE